jgi:CHASE3 domain sensor protein
LTALLRGVVSGVVYLNVLSMVTTFGRVKHADNVIASFIRLQSMMIDRERGELGYMMSGDEKFQDLLVNQEEHLIPSLINYKLI